MGDTEDLKKLFNTLDLNKVSYHLRTIVRWRGINIKKRMVCWHEESLSQPLGWKEEMPLEPIPSLSGVSKVIHHPHFHYNYFYITMRWINMHITDFDEVADFFDTADVDGNKEVTFEEFKAAMDRRKANQ